MFRHQDFAYSRGIAKYAAAVGALVLLSWQGAAEAQTPSRVRSNGALVTSNGSSVGKSFLPLEVNSNPGTDAIPERTKYPSADELFRLSTARPVQAPVGIESIIGKDARKRVTKTTAYPARATALIVFGDGGGGTFICTGWFVSKDTIITAGHCVAPGGTNTFYPMNTYSIYPGRNGPGAGATVAPYGFCTANTLFSVSGWLASQFEDYDFGAIKLNCDIGNTVGWYGAINFDDATLAKQKVTIQGYPGDKSGAVALTQWQGKDKVRAFTSRQVFYQVDTFGGQSGSPIWTKVKKTCDVCSFGIHAYGLHGTAPHVNNNHGTRIDATVLSNIQAAIATPKAP